MQLSGKFVVFPFIYEQDCRCQSNVINRKFNLSTLKDVTVSLSAHAQEITSSTVF